MPLIWEVTINDPPTKYTIPYKKPKYDKDNKLITEQVHYLTANLFYNNNLSFHIVSKIINEVKLWLRQYMNGIPDIEKMQLHILYRSNKHIDLDNKAYFWRKLFMDILKTPTSRQLIKAKEKNRIIITTNTIKDDDTKCVDSYQEYFELGGHSITFRIYGRLANEQKQINLFTNI